MKNAFLILVFALLSAFVASAQNKDSKMTQTQTQTQPQTEVTVTYEIIQQGTYSGIKEAVARVITTQKDWAELWKKHTSVLVPQPPAPEIDFDTDVVAVISSGEKRTSGYRIVMKSIAAEGNDVVVNYMETEPPADSFTLQVLTQPFVMIKISKPVGSVRLSKQTSN